MAIEILDKGACKAAGFINIHPNDPAVVRTQGILRVLLTGTVGHIQLELEEPIADTEFLFFGGLQVGDTAVGVECVSISDSVKELRAVNDVGSAVNSFVWFGFFRMTGGTPTIVPPLPPA